jgi:hypothetical protein
MTKLAACCLALVPIAACGGAPADPSSGPTVFTEGRYFLTVTAPAGLQGCAPVQEGLVLSRAVTLALVRDGGEWLGRADPLSGGDVELRFREGTGRNVDGTLRGTLVTAVGPGGVVALGASFSTATSGAAQLTGTLVVDLKAAHGRVDGVITFIDSQRDPMRCPTAEWTLSRGVF